MSVNKIKISLISLFFLSQIFACGIKRPNSINLNTQSTTYNALSENMIHHLIDKKSTNNIKDSLASLSVLELQKGLPFDEQRKAFWINIYNAYVIDLLRNNPQLFEDRGAFFTEKRINIAGLDLSLDDIENGLIRKSQFKFGLGYIRKVFPPSFERKLRVKQRDYRIHFAINCGAKSCPPVDIYSAETVDKQLQNATIDYLKYNTQFNKESNILQTSTLMSWFRGDFGGKNGSIKILKELKLVPQNLKPTLTYGTYDWTLDINNFAK
jgi:hypothetical protein